MLNLNLNELRSMTQDQLEDQLSRGAFTVADVITAVMGEVIEDKFTAYRAEVQLPAECEVAV